MTVWVILNGTICFYDDGKPNSWSYLYSFILLSQSDMMQQNKCSTFELTALKINIKNL